MCLHAQPPLRVREAVLDTKLCVAIPLRAIHRLQEKVLIVIVGKKLGRRARLRKYQLELLPFVQDNLRAGFGAHADPVDAGWRRPGTIGFYSHLKAVRMKSFNQRLVELQQRLAAGAYHIGAACLPGRPQGRNARCQLRCCKAAAAGAIGAPKIGIAKLADGGGAVLFAAAPEIAARKAAKDGRTAALRTLTLQGIIHFFDQIDRHGCAISVTKVGL